MSTFPFRRRALNNGCRHVLGTKHAVRPSWPWPHIPLIYLPLSPLVAVHKRGEKEAKDEHQWANLHGGRFKVSTQAENN